jgi:hypothetical protein
MMATSGYKHVFGFGDVFLGAVVGTGSSLALAALFPELSNTLGGSANGGISSVLAVGAIAIVARLRMRKAD